MFKTEIIQNKSFSTSPFYIYCLFLFSLTVKLSEQFLYIRYFLSLPFACSST